MSLQGHRKFALAALVVIVAAVLCAFDKLAGGEFVTVTVATVGAFMTANWAQAKDAAKDKAAP